MICFEFHQFGTPALNPVLEQIVSEHESLVASVSYYRRRRSLVNDVFAEKSLKSSAFSV